jgi:protein ImuB
VPAALVDAAGAPVRVDGRGALSAPPAGVALGAGPTRAVRGYAGPFPADERWWEPGDHRRRARLQVVVAGGAAYLLALERGAWSLEGTYD